MKNDIDFEEQRTRINKMIIDMEHDVKQRMNWDERIQAQNKQWQFQKWVAVFTLILGIFAIAANAYVRVHPNIFLSDAQITVKNEAIERNQKTEVGK